MSTPSKHHHSHHQEVESKVKKYIETVKRSDSESRKLHLVKKSDAAAISLEELYEVETPGDQFSPESVDLSRTLRVLKEKDMVILKLRQSYTELALKYADSQNTIDEIRFGKRGAAAIRKDVSVETESRVLDQQCVDWLEKVQNWRTDQVFNTSHEDSCGDSGFRGSELDLKNTLTQIPNITPMVEVRVSTTAQNTSTTIPSSSRDSLEPLLEEATELAKIVKEKSLRLATMLKE